jgi:class 3 adenylate cyclase/predicted ATPase/energy-coupling factor transporter ATP-binding protein EcfA2
VTFDDILEQVITLLKRQGRVSYPALKIRFSLDDEYLEALKAEIIEAQQLATDENGRVLVWAGNTAEPAAAISPPAQPAPQPHAQQQPSPQVAPLPTAPPPPDAERRQLTVMFCDLVDSTRLSSQLDPEDWRDVVREYQRVCTDVIQRYDGYIAQLLGDGLLVYLGYPHAHEDDAQRAVRAGLGMLAALGDLNRSLQPAKGVQLAIRVGVHTGLVVVGEMGGAGRQEQLALGEVPNIASRIEGLAAANMVAISEATYRLVQGYFACQDLGVQTLRGVAEPLHVYHVLSESGVHSRLDIASARGLTPLVGREQEVGLLRERWAQVKAGYGQVVLLSGDAGIGKSRLVQVLKELVAHEPHVRWECRSAEYSQNTALFPLVDLFQRLLRFQPEDTPDEKLEKLEHALSQYRLPVEESVQLFAPLLSLPLPEERSAFLALSPQRQRQQTLETLVAMLLELAEHHPMLFILEDLHWTDPTTLEFLSLLVEQVPTAAIYTLLTCRPHFQPSWHHRSYLSEVTVHRLSHTQVEQIVTGMTNGKAFPAEVLAQIVEKTDGVPLFVEEITKAILESGQLKVLDGHYEFTGSLRTLSIPATLQDSLMARLDRLVTAKAVAQYAAVIGRQFSYDLLHAVSQVDEAMLQHELDRLVEAEIIYQRGLPPHSTYVFKHALIQDAAYESLLKSTRQRYHQRIAQVLEEQFPETVEGHPELLAQHYTEAGLIEQAVGYWHKAGQSAVQRSAHVEALTHLRQGLELLQTLPRTPQRLEREVDMLITLGASLIAVKGYGAAEVGQTYTRARQLCEHLEDPYQLFPVLRGLWSYYLVRAELQTAHTLGEQLLTLAQQTQDPVMLSAADRAVGTTLLFLGAAVDASTHLTQDRALYDLGAWGLWCLGYPDQALVRSHQTVTLVQQIAYPFSLSWALGSAAMVHQFRREVRAAQERAEATISLAKEQGFPTWMALGAMLHGWALVHQGQAREGIAQITQGLTAYRATGAEIVRPYFLALLAEAHGTIAQPEAGLAVLAEALTLVDSSGERFYEAELHRLKGELLLQQASETHLEAETCFQHAIRIAQSQQAKSWELRAAMSLACLWQQQGKRQEAYDLLASVYGWFTEGFDTADLQDAKVLLHELEDGR